MRYFPISVDTKDRSILILGGGNKATNKVRTLIKTEFKIYVISLEFNEELIALRDEHPEQIHLKGRMLNDDFVFFGYDYCIIATNDVLLNNSLEDRAKKSNIPYYRADNIGDSSFLFNEIVNNSTLSVSVSSDGLNPTMSKIITSDVEKTLMKYDEEKIDLLNIIRRQLIIQNYPNVEEEIEHLVRQNLAVVKEYAEALDQPRDNTYEEVLVEVEAKEAEEAKKEEEINMGETIKVPKVVIEEDEVEQKVSEVETSENTDTDVLEEEENSKDN
ncbi:MAG: hypothetical protein GXZ08_01345 [Tissierellia bacterium]|nr:hypothetical protein [Tissierellia bacterium]